MDFYGFYTGKIFDAYKFLGAHVEETGVVFRTFAPNAEKITLIGEFNGWKEQEMEKVYDGNFWELTVESAKPGMMYKYRIYDKTGRSIDHCDPFGFGMELRPNSASVVRNLCSYEFGDALWLEKRCDHKNTKHHFLRMVCETNQNALRKY